MADWLFTFGGGTAQAGDGLGPRGAELVALARLGLPVPAGFVLSERLCAAYGASGRLPADFAAAIDRGLDHIARLTGRRLGDAVRPLVLRVGAATAMPGLAGDILHLGLDDRTVEALARETGDARVAHAGRRRFVQTFAAAALGLDGDDFDDLAAAYKEARGLSCDDEMDAEDERAVVAEALAFAAGNGGRPPPESPAQQLREAIVAVLKSWRSGEAAAHRRLHGLADTGTAVIVQAMVSGAGANSAVGVAFSRDPASGDARLAGDYLPDAEADDLAGGLRPPLALTRADVADGLAGPALEEALPEAFADLCAAGATLERHYGAAAEMAFTIERGRLWLTGARPARVGARAALKIAVALVAEGVAGRDAALAKLDPLALEEVLHPSLDRQAPRDIFAVGLPASPGAAVGIAVFSAAEAVAARRAERAAILIRAETGADDVRGIIAAAAVVTARGGLTSHAAVVARGLGRPCVAGAGALRIDASLGTAIAGGRVVRCGDVVTVDGTTGALLLGAVPLSAAAPDGDLAIVLGWADAIRTLGVRANADTPADAGAATALGAEGIGLCRTEHMFFAADSIMAIRALILADDAAARRRAIDRLLPLQRADFAALLAIMAGRPLTVRLLDPPLHEFLPHGGDDSEATAAALGVSVERLGRRLETLAEVNPMLGHRGVRLAVSHPEIVDMQARALFEAAAERLAAGAAVEIELLVPLVAFRAELDFVRRRIAALAATVAAERGVALTYRLGAMIELPRAALAAGEMAGAAEFFSFGTNDLTQTTLGLSRDDAGRFLPAYARAGLIARDPFATLDAGVAELIRLAAARGRAARPDLLLGLCGEHGGDPASIRLAAEIGLDYVSCSPYRVPIARLAAAQAALAMRDGDDGTAAP